jgi:RNAse (barnase) inhibitor barstar
MREIIIDCSGVCSTEEFWKRYLDAAKPEGAAMFGRNLDAFWDAIEGGGPGWPGKVSLVFMHTAHLSGLQARSGSVSFLDALKAIADQTSAGNLRFVD